MPIKAKYKRVSHHATVSFTVDCCVCLTVFPMPVQRECWSVDQCGHKLSSEVNRKKRSLPTRTREMLVEYFCEHMLCMYVQHTLFSEVIIANTCCFLAIHRNDFST